MKRFRRLLALLLLSALLLSACAPALPETPGSDRKETEPGETEPGETEPRETEPRETEPGETEPGETEPGETEPGTENLPPLDLSSVSFPSATVLADGNAHALSVVGTLPDGVNVTYRGNGQTLPGVYVVTACFSAAGYAPADLQATLTVLSGDDRVGPAVFTDETYTALFALDPAFADTEYRVPDGTVRLCPRAMLNADVTALYVPPSVTEIGAFAFGFRENASGACVRIPGFTAYGKADSAAEAYCRAQGIPFSAVSEISLSSAEDLYVKDGLTLLLTSFPGMDHAQPGKGIWRATVGANATLSGGAYHAENNPAGWRLSDDGGVYYRIANMELFRAKRAETGIVLSADALQKDGKASPFTVETVFLPLGLSGEDNVIIDHETDNGNKGYSRFGAYAGSRSTFAFLGLQLCFFHYSTATSGNSMRTRVFYQSNAWEATDTVGGGGVMSNTTYSDHLLFSDQIHAFGGGAQYLRVTRALTPAEDYTRTSFLVEAPYGTVSRDNNAKPSTFYEAAQLPRPFEMFFAFPAVVYSIRAYTRALTPKEIAQNHFADLCAYFDLDLSLLSSMLPSSLPAIYEALSGWDLSSPAGDVRAAYTAACVHAPRYRLTVRCVLPDGTLLQTAEYALPDGEPYSVPAPVLPGYVTRSLTVFGTMHGGDTVTLSYFPTSASGLSLPNVAVVGGDTAAGVGSQSLSGFTATGIDPASVGSTRYGASVSSVLQNLIRARVCEIRVSAFGVMNEDLATVSARMGTVQDGITLETAVTVAPGATVSVSLAQGGNGILRSGNDTAVNPVTITGRDAGGNPVTAEGYLSVSATGGDPATAAKSELRYTFTRTDGGTDPVTFSAGARVRTATEKETEGAWLLLFAGETGGADPVSRLRAMIAAAGAERYLIIGALSGNRSDNAETDAALSAAFGDCYLNPREALGSAALAAFGLSAGGYAGALSEGSVPSVFLQDKNHLGALGHAALARALFERMTALGWFDEILDQLEAAASASVCFAPEER